MKYKKFMQLFIIAIISQVLFYNMIKCQNAVTYLDDNLWGGRLGDKLIMYVKAKWVSYKYGLDFYYKPFKYSDQLMMHKIEKLCPNNFKKQFAQEKLLKEINNKVDFDHDMLNSKDTLYTIHYYFSLPQWGKAQKLYDGQEITDWDDVFNDEYFRNELRKIIKPRQSIQLVQTPTDRISIAVHIRKGGGFDWPLFSEQEYEIDKIDQIDVVSFQVHGTYSDRSWPLKFPPDQFYIDSIKKISEMLGNSSLYVYIFTDDPNPTVLLEKYKNIINKPNIEYECRQNKNHYSINVLEDLFSMAKFDCLIRSGSNLPQIAQLIGHHSIVIFPKSAKWIGKRLVVDDIGCYNKS